jgi:hypothetical protein
MKLVYLNKELDSSLEHELFSENEYGFKVTVTYKDSRIDVMNNCTEVHNKYESYRGDCIAFESDIHVTGCTRTNCDIESVIIENAEKILQKFIE